MSEPAHNYFAWRIGELEQHVALVARVKELERQRDAAVAVLQKGQTPALPVGAYSFLALSWRDAIDAALAALGAEETK